MSEYWEQFLGWWRDLTPAVQTAIQAGCTLFLALVIGEIVSRMVTRVLTSRGLDAALRLPGAGPTPPAPATGPAPFGTFSAAAPAVSSAPLPEAEHGITPTFLLGMLVRATAWAGGAWYIAFHAGRTDVADRIALVVSRTWAMAGVIVAALALGSILARRLVDWLDGDAHRPGARRSASGAVAAVVYVFVTLLVLLIGSDMFNWPLTRGSTSALWSLAHHLFVAGAALAIGWFGARWARDLALEAAAAPEKRAGQYTALGIVAATTVLAVAVLLSSFGVLIGLACLAVVGLGIWLVRGYLPDVFAGLQLRSSQVREVWFDGIAWQITDIGFVSTQVGRGGEFARVQNRLVLDARMHGKPAETSQGA